MRIEHPRAAKGLRPPAQVHVAQRDTREVDDDGYVDVPDERATHVMDAFARQYDVEYDDGGDVVLPETTDREDEPPDTDTPTSAEHTADKSDFDLESFLDRSYTDRSDAVAAGDVDAHLDALESAETSQTVKDAIETRRDELQEE